ncbi:MAG TPA: DUF503 domain-containing protein [Firmicutes bacterium]|nr:DUF503 domain-containing protein [Bacillota bacterium]
MFVGLMEIKLRINVQVSSLKDKRRIVKGLKDRLRNSFNLSVSETDTLDSFYTAELGFSTVSNDKKMIDGILSKALHSIEKTGTVTIEEVKTEIL